jgi:hypothetical protein
LFLDVQLSSIAVEEAEAEEGEADVAVVEDDSAELELQILVSTPSLSIEDAPNSAVAVAMRISALQEDSELLEPVEALLAVEEEVEVEVVATDAEPKAVI